MSDRKGALAGAKSFFDQANIYQAVFTFVFLFLIGAIFVPRFLTGANMINVVRQAALTLMFSFGMSLTMLLAGLDLSIGAIGALSSVLAAGFIKNGDVMTGLIIALGVGLLFGALNGGTIAFLKVPPFIMTFGMMKIANGLALNHTNGEAIYGFPESFRALGFGSVLGIPMPVVISAVVLILLHLLLFRTVTGHSIYAIGDNRNAARFSGIPVRKTITLTYAISGLLAGVAGAVYIARLGSAEAIMGSNWPLQAIAASVLGGVSFGGGKGSVVGTAIGALCVAMIYNVMNLLGVSPSWQIFVVGFVIILVISFDFVRTKMDARVFVKNQLTKIEADSPEAAKEVSK